MRKFLFISALVLSALACGVSSQLPEVDAIPTSHEAVPTSTPESVRMIVTADEGLNIRVCPNVDCMELEGDLLSGEIVTCDKFQAPMNGDGLWCRHERGWSNARWMEVVK